MRPIRHMKKVVLISSLLLILTLSLGGGVASKGNDTAATYENLRLFTEVLSICLLYTSPSPRDRQKSRMPSSA